MPLNTKKLRIPSIWILKNTKKILTIIFLKNDKKNNVHASNEKYPSLQHGDFQN